MSRYEVEVTFKSGRDLKNVNWRHGPTRPYVVVWVDPERKLSTKVDEEGDAFANWEERLIVPFPPTASIYDTALYIEVIHFAKPDEEDVKVLIGSAKVRIHEVVEEVGIGGTNSRTLKLKRPSGRPQGKLEIDLAVKQNPYYAPQDSYGAPDYSVPSSGYPYSGPPAGPGYPYSGPPAGPGYPYSGPPAGPEYPYSGPPAGPGYPYSGPPYPQPTSGNYPYPQSPSQGESSYHKHHGDHKKSKFGGMGTGLVIGALAGGAGMLLAEKGIEALEDHIADEVAERLEEEDLSDRDGF